MLLSYPLILASASPRRQQLLRQLNLPFIIHTADIDETPLPAELPADLVCRLSRQKAAAIADNHPHALIIAADTTVALDTLMLGKPNSPAQAREMLLLLQNKPHQVYSAITLLQPAAAHCRTTLSTSTVTMRPYTPAEIETYLATGDPFDKAGSYAIQHPQFAPVARITGCYAGVMGFPLGHLADELAHFGITLPPIADTCTAATGQPCCRHHDPGF